MLKISPLFNKFTNLPVISSKALWIKKAKFSGYCFYMNTNLRRDFQIYIDVPLKILTGKKHPQIKH